MGGIATELQVSAGGVAYRQEGERIEVALIAVGGGRWQLPKGLVDEGEANEEAALREVREEAGLTTEMAGPIDTIEYWYVSTNRGRRVRYHKYVHFFLMRYLSGDVADHDNEVEDARWVEVGEAQEMLSFKNEKNVVAKAREMIEARA